MTRPAARSSSTSRSHPTRDGQTLKQTQRILTTSRLGASSLHGSGDHSVRAQAANSLHMPHGGHRSTRARDTMWRHAPRRGVVDHIGV